MSLFAKIMVVVNFILAVVFLAAAGTFLGAQEDWKNQHKEAVDKAEQVRKGLQDQIDQRQRDLDAANTRAGQLEVAKATAETGQASAQESLRTLNEKNAQLQQSLDRLSETMTTMEQTNQRQQGDISRLQGELNDARTQTRQARDGENTANGTIAQLEQQVDDLTKQVQSLETKSTADAEKLDGLNTALSLYQSTFGALPEIASPIAVDGRVQAVDNEMDIFVISVGEKDKVKVGFEFTVYRGNQYVSTIVVDQVFPNHASCHTKAGMKKGDVKPGDEVATRL